ncbi:hypothetical protein GCM10009838_53620 [Catenulispora subtropica]|uniref:Uncharacterized protein n=1 Tax=Catenulispora subtropica TaxID=450798 RepID=A0ABN2SDS7_9ACTN
MALVAASGGNVGIIDKAASGTQGTGSLLWSAVPGGNPHAIERIPTIGAIVTTSSGGCLHVPKAGYGPGTAQASAGRPGEKSGASTTCQPLACGGWTFRTSARRSGR